MMIRRSFIAALLSTAGWLLSPLFGQRTATKAQLREKLLELYGRDRVGTIEFSPQAERGRAATGVVIYEVESRELYLDTTPCESNKKILPFSPEYIKEPTDSVRCGSRKYEQSHVTQK